MKKIAATEFKAKCLALMDRVAEHREGFVITKRGKPVARLLPVEQKPKDSMFGWLRGKGSITGDIISPVLPPEAWETLKECDTLMTRERIGKRRRKRSSRRTGKK